jgi:F-type H+-transporting ATPase subunit b
VRRWLACAPALALFIVAASMPAASHGVHIISNHLAAVAFAENHAPAASGGHENLFDLINLLILIAVLVYLLRKPVGQFFSGRSAEIRKGLEEGREALEAAQSKLQSAEEKMRGLEHEIASLKETALREMAAERDRVRQAAQAEAERILASAQSMIEAATRSAKLELKNYAADRACELAGKMIREQLNPESQARLVSGFINGLPRSRE